MKTPYFPMTPDYSPVVKLMAMQTRLAVETSQKMFELAMMPWKGMPTPFGLMKAGLSVSRPGSLRSLDAAPATVDAIVSDSAEAAHKLADEVDVVADKMLLHAEVESPEADAVLASTAEAAAAPAEAATEIAETVAEAAPEIAQSVVEAAPEPAPEAVAESAVETRPEPVVDASAKAVEAVVAAMVEPLKLAAPEGAADDLTALNGVGPRLAEALNAQGIWHYSQIAGWTEANVAWVDENLPGVRGRASRNGWVGQATALGK